MNSSSTIGRPSPEVKTLAVNVLLSCVNNLLHERSALMEKADSNGAAGDSEGVGEALADCTYLSAVYLDVLAILKQHALPAMPSGLSLEISCETEGIQ